MAFFLPPDFGFERLRGFTDLKSTVDPVHLLKNLARILDSVCLEARVMDRIINFRSALYGILVFGRLFFAVSGFQLLHRALRYVVVAELQP